jgi:hypothetical protein
MDSIMKHTKKIWFVLPLAFISSLAGMDQEKIRLCDERFTVVFCKFFSAIHQVDALNKQHKYNESINEYNQIYKIASEISYNDIMESILFFKIKIFIVLSKSNEQFDLDDCINTINLLSKTETKDVFLYCKELFPFFTEIEYIKFIADIFQKKGDTFFIKFNPLSIEFYKKSFGEFNIALDKIKTELKLHKKIKNELKELKNCILKEKGNIYLKCGIVYFENNCIEEGIAYFYKSFEENVSSNDLLTIYIKILSYLERFRSSSQGLIQEKINLITNFAKHIYISSVKLRTEIEHTASVSQNLSSNEFLEKCRYFLVLGKSQEFANLYCQASKKIRDEVDLNPSLNSPYISETSKNARETLVKKCIENKFYSEALKYSSPDLELPESVREILSAAEILKDLSLSIDLLRLFEQKKAKIISDENDVIKKIEEECQDFKRKMYPLQNEEETKDQSNLKSKISNLTKSLDSINSTHLNEDNVLLLRDIKKEIDVKDIPLEKERELIKEGLTKRINEIQKEIIELNQYYSATILELQREREGLKGQYKIFQDTQREELNKKNENVPKEIIDEASFFKQKIPKKQEIKESRDVKIEFNQKLYDFFNEYPDFKDEINLIAHAFKVTIDNGGITSNKISFDGNIFDYEKLGHNIGYDVIKSRGTNNMHQNARLYLKKTDTNCFETVGFGHIKSGSNDVIPYKNMKSAI